MSQIQSIAERLYWAGFQAHRASLDSRNSKGIRAIEEQAQEDATKTLRDLLLSEAVWMFKSQHNAEEAVKAIPIEAIEKLFDKEDTDAKNT